MSDQPKKISIDKEKKRVSLSFGDDNKSNNPAADVSKILKPGEDSTPDKSKDDNKPMDINTTGSEKPASSTEKQETDHETDKKKPSFRNSMTNERDKKKSSFRNSMNKDLDGRRPKTSVEFRKSLQRSGSRLSATRERSLSRLKVRKSSYGFGSVPGIRPIERSSIPIEFRRPPLIYLNTYQLGPFVNFHPPAVEKATNEVLDEWFDNHKYHPQQSPALALQISGCIMRKIKYMGFNRYRVVSIVVIGQRRNQCYNNAVTFLWDERRDNYVDIVREESTCFIQITSFAIYFD